MAIVMQLSATLVLWGSLLACVALSAQRSTPAELRLDNLYAGEAVQAFDLRPRAMKGSLYYSDLPMDAAVKLANGKVLTGYAVLYNLETDILEIITEEQVYALPGTMIAEFTLEEPGVASSPGLTRFVRTAAIPSGEQLPNIGFLKYEVEAGLSLFTGYEVEIYKPNYVPALDAGSLQPKAVKKERFFLYDGKSLQPIPTKKKKALDFFETYRPDVSQLVKENNIDLNEAAGLARLVELLN